MIDRTRRLNYRLPFIAIVVVLGLAGPLNGQAENFPRSTIGTTITTELYSPWEHDAEGKSRYNRQLATKSCLSLTLLKWGCNRGTNISYGNRFGDNWDILALHGTQSRMIDLGKAEMTGDIKVPYIAPFRAVGPGEKRHITVNTSGGDGVDGKPGLNADGTSARYNPRPRRESFANKPIAQQVSSKTETKSGEVFEDTYNPFLEARAGHVYALRLLEGEIDRYFLMRIDEVIKGQKIRITLKLVDTPIHRPIY